MGLGRRFADCATQASRALEELDESLGQAAGAVSAEGDRSGGRHDSRAVKTTTAPARRRSVRSARRPWRSRVCPPDGLPMDSVCGKSTGRP